MAVNPKNVIKLLEEEFGDYGSSSVNESDRDMARQISGILKTRLKSTMQISEECELVFEDPSLMDTDGKNNCDEVADYFLEEELVSSEELTTQCSSSSSYHLTPVPVPQNKREDIPFSKRKRAVEYWKGSTKRRRTISSVQHSFRFVESLDQLQYWSKQIVQDGPQHEKLSKINTLVRDKFIDARAKKRSVHDEHLRRWALTESRNAGLNFKASHGWLNRFKKCNRITSRKITKFVSKVAVEQAEKIADSARLFVESVHEEMQNFKTDDVFNTDQSGFNLELHAGRTLAEVGDKHVDATAQSIAATTHSYTIMPTVTASGKLLSPLVIVTKESNGEFGKYVEQSMFKARNILPIAAKSSMMGKKEILLWFKDAFLPNTGENSLLLVDSLNSYKAAKDTLSKEKNITIKTIPPHTTGEVQPLDVYFFRPWKNFCRKISDFVLLENIDFSLRVRNNVYKLQSFIHNQFSAPRFQSFRQYTWYKAGYIKGDAPSFTNPVDYCFKSGELTCSVPDCGEVKLVQCAWCEKPLCINHSLVDGHFHDPQ